MTFWELRATMHVRFGTPFTTDLNVIFPPPVNIVSFAKSHWPFATLEHLPPGQAHAFGTPASRGYRCAALRSWAIQPTFLQPAFAACVRSGPPAPVEPTATAPTTSAPSRSRNANLRLTLTASAAGRPQS